MAAAYTFGAFSFPLLAIASMGIPMLLAFGIVAVGAAIGGVVIFAKREIESRL